MSAPRLFDDRLWQITAPHFCAGIIESGGRVTTAAPIIGYMISKPMAWVHRYCTGKRWMLEKVGK